MVFSSRSKGQMGSKDSTGHTTWTGPDRLAVRFGGEPNQLSARLGLRMLSQLKPLGVSSAWATRKDHMNHPNDHPDQLRLETAQ